MSGHRGPFMKTDSIGSGSDEGGESQAILRVRVWNFFDSSFDLDKTELISSSQCRGIRTLI
jgi:hypothetical protein